jgi:hypothetical protein
MEGGNARRNESIEGPLIRGEEQTRELRSRAARLGVLAWGREGEGIRGDGGQQGREAGATAPTWAYSGLLGLG